MEEEKRNDQKTYTLADQIMEKEEYFSIEDYGELLAFKTTLQTNQRLDLFFSSKVNMNKDYILTNTTVRANFLVDGKAKEIFIEKKALEKIYEICKIYSEDNKFINIIIKRADKYDTDEILKRINGIKFFKGAFNSINIKEFPIKNYYLEERQLPNIGNNSGDIQKVFILKKKSLNNKNLNNNLSDNIDLDKLRETWISFNNNASISNNNVINQNIEPLKINIDNNSHFNQNNNINSGAQINNNNNNASISNNNIKNQNIEPLKINIDNNSHFNQNNNINSGAQINNNNIMPNYYNMNQNYNSNQINLNYNFNNNNICNNNFNQNNNMNLMYYKICMIIQYINENSNVLKQINNIIQQNYNNQMKYNLLQTINNLFQLNYNIPLNNSNIYVMKQEIDSLLNQISNNNYQMTNNNKNQINNNFNQNSQANNYKMNQLNNGNQMNNYLQQLKIPLKKIYDNIHNIIILFNKEDKINENNKEIKNNKENKNNGNFLFEEYEDYFPLIGLRNVGLTCYMNSILQCLLHIPQLNGFFINKYLKEKDELNKINNDTDTRGRLCEEYHKVVLDVLKQQGEKKDYISPKDFNKFLSNVNGGQFARYEANDAKDLLLYLFQAMHAELNYQGDQKLKNVPKCNQLIEKESFEFFITVNNNLNLSIISYLFYGVHKSKTICSGCNNTLYNFQYFQFLSFPTFNYKDKEFNLYQGFKEFIRPELMHGDNQCYCQKCKGLRDAKVTTKIFSTPPYLIINIDYGKNKKYKPDKVVFGGIIDIKNFVENTNNSTRFKLIAVSTHLGRSGNTGHYITYCQSNENKWYEFNDSSVTETKFDKINSNSPYVLIYKRI